MRLFTWFWRPKSNTYKIVPSEEQLQDAIKELLIKRRARHKVSPLKRDDGLYFVRDGRDGLIYWIKSGKVCEIEWEMSAVPQYHILVFEETMNKWNLPVEQEMTIEEKSQLKAELKRWLIKKRIKADLIDKI